MPWSPPLLHLPLKTPGFLLCYCHSLFLLQDGQCPCQALEVQYESMRSIFLLGILGALTASLAAFIWCHAQLYNDLDHGDITRWEFLAACSILAALAGGLGFLLGGSIAGTLAI